MTFVRDGAGSGRSGAAWSSERNSGPILGRLLDHGPLFPQFTGLERTSWPVSRTKIDSFRLLSVMLNTCRKLRRHRQEHSNTSHHSS